MNKVILMGRLTRDPEVFYSNNANGTTVTRFALAVNRRFKVEGKQDVDFINCVSFGKNAEFVQKYFKKGQMVSVVGSLRIESYDGKDGQKRYSTDVAVDEAYFAESKSSYENRSKYEGNQNNNEKSNIQNNNNFQSESDFAAIDEDVDEGELPF